MSIDDIEHQIREREAVHVAAILDRDEAVLSTPWSPDLMVNAPNNAVSDVQGTISAMRAGFVHYHDYQQSIESVRIFGDTAVVLGQETVKPVMGPDGGKTVQRRFLNVWQRSGDEWLQIARQATVISAS